MGSLTPFWRRLEIEPDPHATLDEWRTLLGNEFVAVEPLLKPSGMLAATVPSPRRNAPVQRVVTHADGGLVAVCDNGISDRRELEPDEVLLHTLEIRAFRRTITDSLALRTATSPAKPLSEGLRLGDWEPQPATSFPVVFIAHTSEVLLRNLIRENALNSSKPMMVIVPTDDAWCNDLCTWLESQLCLLVVADDVLEIVGDAWVATDLWSNRLECFKKIAGFTREAGTQNKRPRRRRASRTATIESLQSELAQELQSRAMIVKHARESGQEPVLPKLTQKELARRVGCTETALTNAKNDPAGKQIKLMLALLNDPDGLLRWWGSQRRLFAANFS